MDIFNNNYVPDFNLPINPVKTVTRKINMHFDSAFRDNYYKQSASDFMYTLPNSINNIMSLKLTSVDIPNSWYTISFIDKTNCFTIELKGKCFCNTYDIKVPDGNYSAQELIDYLNCEYFYLSNSTDKYLKCIKVSLMENSLRVRFEIIKDGIKIIWVGRLEPIKEPILCIKTIEYYRKNNYLVRTQYSLNLYFYTSQ